MGSQFHFDPDTYLAMVLAEVPAYRELQAAIATAASGLQVRRILDLGTGTGETALAVCSVYPQAQLTGVDESPEMLERARVLLPGADLRVGQLEAPLPDGPFDVVSSALAVHHLDSVAKADLFRRVSAVLRPGGRFVLGDVVVPDDPRDALTPVDGIYDKPSTAADQLRWLADAGMRASLAWERGDLAVLVGDTPSEQ